LTTNNSSGQSIIDELKAVRERCRTTEFHIWADKAYHESLASWIDELLDKYDSSSTSKIEEST